MILAAWQLNNLVAYAGNTIVTFSIGSSPRFSKVLGTQTNKQISEKYPTLVAPSGYAFAIWGPIFLLEGASVIWQCFQNDAAFKAASPFWCLGCLLQAGWTIAFAYEKIGLSSMLIGGIAASIGSAFACTTQLGDHSTTAVVLGTLPFAMHTACRLAYRCIHRQYQHHCRRIPSKPCHPNEAGMGV